MSGEFPLRRDNVAVLIPALNEELRIAEVVHGCLQECDTVIVVDDEDPLSISDAGKHRARVVT